MNQSGPERLPRHKQSEIRPVLMFPRTKTCIALNDARRHQFVSTLALICVCVSSLAHTWDSRGCRKHTSDVLAKLTTTRTTSRLSPCEQWLDSSSPVTQHAAISALWTLSSKHQWDHLLSTRTLKSSPRPIWPKRQNRTSWNLPRGDQLETRCFLCSWINSLTFFHDTY